MTSLGVNGLQGPPAAVLTSQLQALSGLLSDKHSPGGVTFTATPPGSVVLLVVQSPTGLSQSTHSSSQRNTDGPQCLGLPGKGQQRGSWPPNLRSREASGAWSSLSPGAQRPRQVQAVGQQRRGAKVTGHLLGMTGRGCQKLQPRGFPRRTPSAPAPSRAGGGAHHAKGRAGADPVQPSPKPGHGTWHGSGGQATWAGLCTGGRGSITLLPGRWVPHERQD